MGTTRYHDLDELSAVERNGNSRNIKRAPEEGKLDLPTCCKESKRCLSLSPSASTP